MFGIFDGIFNLFGCGIWLPFGFVDLDRLLDGAFVPFIEDVI
jgi:hypothetical protein